MYAYCRIQKHESSPPPDLHPLSFFFLDNTNPADVHVIRHAWRICCSIYETFRSTVMIIYTAKKIYITRRRGLCYIIIFLQSYSYLHTALLKWRLTTDSISENGGGVPSHSLDLPPTPSTLYVHVRLQKQRSVKNNKHLISLLQ